MLNVLALGRWAGHRLALPIFAFAIAALVDSRAHVERIIFANDDVVAARIDGIALFDGYPTFAFVAEDLQPADSSPTVQITIMQFVFLDDVVIERSQVFLGQELASEKARAAEAFQAAANRARRQRWA